MSWHVTIDIGTLFPRAYSTCLLAYLQYIRFGSIWFGSVQFGSVRFNLIRFGSIWFDSVQFGSIRFVSIQFDSVRFDLVRFDLVRFDLVLFCSIWFGSYSLSQPICNNGHRILTIFERNKIEEDSYICCIHIPASLI